MPILLGVATLGIVIGTISCTGTLKASLATTTTTFPHTRAASGGTIPLRPTFLPREKLARLSEVPTTTGPGRSTAEVSVLQPDPATLMAFGQAAASYEAVLNCVVDTIPGTVHLARIKANGVMVAIAGVKPSPSCIANYRANPRYLENLETTPPPLVGVFSEEPGQGWMMRTEIGRPFPCQATPVFGPMYTAEVLKAWQIPYYSSDCATYFPPGPA
jgi:hypothetical protein